MRRFITFTLALVMAIPLSAQTRNEALLEYQANRKKALTEYKSNYRQACADFMRRRWEAFNIEAPEAIPERKEPTEPIVKERPETEQPQPTTPSAQPEQPKSPEPQTSKPELQPTREPQSPQPQQPAEDKGKSDDPRKIIEPRKPVTDTPEAETPKADTPKADNPKIDTSRSLKFTFYGTECSVSFNSSHSLNLSSISENAVASAWQTIASGRFDRIYEECKAICASLNLNDWGYYLLVRTIADTCYGEKSPKSLLLQSFLMSEAGFKVRLARGNNRLWLLMAVNEKVYSRPFFKIGGGVFYLLEGGSSASRYEVCNFSIPGERPLSLTIKEMPHLNYRPWRSIKRTDRSQNTEMAVSVNMNMVTFMNDYPPCDWSVYASAQLSERTESEVLPTLRRLIQDKGEVEAVQRLLSFIHNAFPYRTDAQQFGTERTLFAEEMFAYDYSDCEDRAILFALLVRKLMNLEVILIHYPEHIATGVCFSGGVAGDKVRLGQREYVICDPTYVGADVGEAMPEYRNVSAKLIKIE